MLWRSNVWICSILLEPHWQATASMPSWMRSQRALLTPSTSSWFTKPTRPTVFPRTRLFQAALAKVGTLVSFSSFMDETAQQADLILPNHMALERFDDAIGLRGTPYAYYALASPILNPPPGTKHTGEILLAMAAEIRGGLAEALPWKDYKAYLQKRVEGLAASKKGMVSDAQGKVPWKLQAGDLVEANYKDGADLWKKLTSGLCWYDAPVDFLQGLDTSSGKLELALNALQAKGLAGAADQVYLPRFAQLAPSGDEKEYPLLLVSYRNMSLASEYLPNPPFMTKNVWDFVLKGKELFVELNPKTAQSLGVKEGSQAVLKTPQGEVPVRVHLLCRCARRRSSISRRAWVIRRMTSTSRTRESMRTVSSRCRWIR